MSISSKSVTCRRPSGPKATWLGRSKPSCGSFRRRTLDAVHSEVDDLVAVEVDPDDLETHWHASYEEHEIDHARRTHHRERTDAGPRRVAVDGHGPARLRPIRTSRPNSAISKSS
jgi:hypothetical protein